MQRTDAYQNLSPRSHVRLRPEMYVSSTSLQHREDYIAVVTEDGTRIAKQEISVSDAVERLFLEILSNASDNIIRSRQAGMDESLIRGVDVSMTADTISVTNYGMTIPLDIHPQMNIPTPTMIFGRLRSSSNYGDDRTGAGVNGLGCKLCVLLSSLFRVTIGNAIQHKIFVQEWYNGMGIESEPQIGDYEQNISFVTIEYKMDFGLMGYATPSYTEVDLALFKRHVMDLSFTSKVETSFNGERFDLRDIKKYVKMFTFVPEEAGSLVHLEYTNKQDMPGHYWNHVNNLPSIEMCVVETPDNASNVAFTNGIFNRNGGTHIEAATTIVSEVLIPKVNALLEKAGSDKKKTGMMVNKKNIRPHISIIIAVRVTNPSFDSQSKTCLKAPKINIKLPEEETNKLSKFSLLYKRLIQEAESKMLDVLKKGEKGGKSRHIFDVDVADANWAGTKRSTDCVLMITEGKSATGYALQAIKYIPGGRDICGIYPMRGKPLNTTNVGLAKIISNTVIMELKKVLRIREGIDYTDDSNYKTLRYGKLLIMADSDEDGKHIIGLVLNIFHNMYKSLLQREFVMILRTPIVRVSRGSNKFSFYSHQEYDAWAQQTTDPNKWEHKYFKGLGSSNKEEVKEDFQNPHYVQIVYDEYADPYLKLAFDKKLSDERKKWIAAIQQPLGIETWQRLPISHFINEELVTFARDNLARSIPRLLDGLKESSRKIMWGAYCQWGGCGRYENGKRKISRTDIKTAPSAKSDKVDSFSGFVYKNTAYKHGQQCLSKTIAGMAADYPGANNMAYFFQDGMFGTRNLNGEDSSQPRYASVKPIWWLPYVYKIEDFPIMEFRTDEGKDQEPVTFLPIIPMVLVNGADGIGSGHSTFIPKFNPLDIIKWYKLRLTGLQYLPEPMPWYRGFKGTIEAVSIKRPTEEETVDHEAEEDDGTGQVTEDQTFDSSASLHRAYRISGCMHQEGNNIIITEIPIGKSIDSYDKFLKKLVEDKLLYDYNNKSDDYEAYFSLEGYKGPVTMRDLRLIANIGITNMILLDNNNVPIKYGSITSILESFYQGRLCYYGKRKQYMLEEEQKLIAELTEKYNFISEVVNGTIVIYKRKISELKVEMEQKGYSKDLCNSVSLSSCTEEHMAELYQKIQHHTQVYNELTQINTENMWLKDLEQLEGAYKRHYKIA